MMNKRSRTDDLTQYHKNIKVAGFKAQITDFKRLMQDLRNDSDCVIQLMDADGIAGRKHAVHAAVHAIKSFSRKENISKDMGLEICVRASGQRQISQALKMLGIKNGKMNVCVVALGCEENIMEQLIDVLGERNDSVLEADEDKLKKLYSISKMEAETAGSVTKLLMERTALLILES